jgi:hypothetical protein
MHILPDVLEGVPPWMRRAGVALFALALLLAGWLRFDRGKSLATWLTIGGTAVALVVAFTFLIERMLTRIPPQQLGELGTAEGRADAQTAITTLWREQWREIERRGPGVIVRRYSIAIFLVLYLVALAVLSPMSVGRIAPLVPRVVLIVGALAAIAVLLALPISRWHLRRERHLVAKFDSQSGAV